ncbi:MAG TPA: hypothetical protein VEQ10_20890 [Vicinamibacteria bacterium]|nr:hypothetical protein [Vicinamibacteria bacterium]
MFLELTTAVVPELGAGAALVAALGGLVCFVFIRRGRLAAAR